MHYLWQRQTDTIIYVRVKDTDIKYYISLPLEDVLETQEKEKNKNTSYPACTK